MSLSHFETPILPGNNSIKMTPALLPADYSRLIAEISARLVKTSNQELDAEILRALRDTLQPLGVDRGGLLKINDDSQVVQISHFWYAEGVEQVSEEINLVELFPWSYQQLVVHGKVRAMSRVEDLPKEAEVDRQTYLLMGTKSGLGIPLFIGQRVRCLIVVQAQKNQCDWPEELITHLRLLGEIIVSALQRRDAETALSNAKENLNLAAASAGAGLWGFDLGSRKFWATEKAREMFGFDPALELTLELFLAKVHVDDRLLIRAALDDASRAGKEIDIEYRVPGTDGQDRWMKSCGRLQPVGVNRQECIMGVAIEITQRKQVERQLRAQLLEIDELKERLEQENLYLKSEAAIKSGRRDLIDSGGLREVMAQVEQVARTRSTVLIQGETGTGKELVAQAIHRLSDRDNRAMVVVNCASLPAALVESELFGREKGAFTGALAKQVGRFELANGSTLFLDEIGELPLETQMKLLRVLQEGKLERLGSPHTINVDVRIIAATNRNLIEEVDQGRFRRDLYYRLHVFPIHVPPLRERREEIPELVWDLVTELNGLMGKKICRIGAQDMEALVACPWPGNVRELRNVLEHAMITSNGEVLQLQHSQIRRENATESLSLEEVERRHIQSVLQTCGGKIKGPGGAAELLGLNPSTLYFRIRKLGITKNHH